MGFSTRQHAKICVIRTGNRKSIWSGLSTYLKRYLTSAEDPHQPILLHQNNTSRAKSNIIILNPCHEIEFSDYFKYRYILTCRSFFVPWLFKLAIATRNYYTSSLQCEIIAQLSIHHALKLTLGYVCITALLLLIPSWSFCLLLLLLYLNTCTFSLWCSGANEELLS